MSPSVQRCVVVFPAKVGPLACDVASLISCGSLVSRGPWLVREQWRALDLERLRVLCSGGKDRNGWLWRPTTGAVVPW